MHTANCSLKSFLGFVTEAPQGLGSTHSMGATVCHTGISIVVECVYLCIHASTLLIGSQGRATHNNPQEKRLGFREKGQTGTMKVKLAFVKAYVGPGLWRWK